MKKFIFPLSLILFTLSCAKDESPQVELPQINETHKSIAVASNHFGLDLYKTVADSEDADENILISPLSVSMALSMVLNGAENNTKSDMLNTLRLDVDVNENNDACKDLMNFLPNVDPDVTTNIANSIWYRNNFNVLPSFIDVNQEHFEAEVTSLDFSDPNAKNIINNWVADKTNDKIPTIIEEISSAHVMFLINAIYFNAPWKKEFDDADTRNSIFTKEDGSTVNVPFMTSDEIDFGYYEDNDLKVMNLPYGNENYSFTAIIPSNSNTLDNIKNNLTADVFQDWQDGLTTGHGYHLMMPKFEIDYKIKMNDALSTMGMSVAFSDGADFSSISGYGDLRISEVLHKTYMKVNEQGTEAAAVTSVGIVETSLPPAFSLDQPFIFVVHEKETNAILFIGRIVDPS